MEWISSYITSWLSYFGFRFNKQCTIILLGLDNAGKTSLCYSLKTRRPPVQSNPTTHVTEQKIELPQHNLTLQCYDMGGHKAARHFWKTYAGTCDAIIFVVDSADQERLIEAKTELHRVCHHSIHESKHQVPVLILANKEDLNYSMKLDEVEKGLDIENLGIEDVLVVSCSVYNNTGYDGGFSWLSEHV